MEAQANRNSEEGVDVPTVYRNLCVTAGLAVLLGACGTVSDVVGGVTGRGDTAPPVATDVAATAASGVVVKCPAVQIRQGTQGVTRYAGGRDGDASAVRYQFSIVRTARDCQFVNGTLTLRVGVAGRVLLGPSGGPGSFSEPMRFVVARGGVEPVYSQARPVQVTVPSGATSAEFDVVDADIRIEVRADETVGNFQIFVGFDA